MGQHLDFKSGKIVKTTKLQDKIFLIGSEFFESLLKLGYGCNHVKGNEDDYSNIPLEYLIAGKLYAESQLILLTRGKKLLKVINKEIDKKILEKYEQKH